QKNQRQAKPQTAALPRRSGAADVLHRRLAPTALDPSRHTVELQDTHRGECQTRERRREPFSEFGHRRIPARGEARFEASHEAQWEEIHREQSAIDPTCVRLARESRRLQRGALWVPTWE